MNNKALALALAIFLVALYATMFLITFGYARAREPYTPNPRFISPETGKSEAAFLRAMGWPLYWSAVYFERSAEKD